MPLINRLRQSFLLVFLLLPATSAVRGDTAPNVLFVIFDDLNDWINGYGGHPQALTPNLDRLRARGVTFTNNHSTATICAPSRPSILTGLYPHTSGFFGGEDDGGSNELWYENPVYAQAKTWVRFYKDSGYDVYVTGKIYHQQQILNTDYTEYGAAQNFGPYPNAGKYPGQEYRGKDGFCASLAAIPEGGWKNFSYVSEENRDATPDEKSTAYVVGKLANTSRTKPFMINLGYHRPHTPMTAPQTYFDLFPLANVQTAPIKPDDLADCAAPMVYAGGGFTKYDGIISNGHLPLFTQAYLACVACADAQLGLVLDALDASPYANNTYIIVTSDHGFHLGEKSYFFKDTLWEESTHVPLIMAGPGIAAGKQITRPVSTVHIYPTLLDLCGLPSQPYSSRPLDGVSLKPLLIDPDNGVWSGPPVALTVILNRDFKALAGVQAQEHNPAWQEYSVRSERFRYILCDTGEEELYDHDADPYEWTNLAADPDFAAVKKLLRAQMEAIVRRPLGPPGKAARVTEVVPTGTNQFQLSFNGETETAYRIMSSPDLATWALASTLTTGATQTTVTTTVTGSGDSKLYWRVERDL